MFELHASMPPMRSAEYQVTISLKFLLIIHNYANDQTINQSKSLPGFRLVVTSLDGISGWLIQTLLRGENDSKQSDEIQANDFSLLRRHLWGSSYFIRPHKYLRNQEQHSFPKLSQSPCTFQILEGSRWLQGNLIITWSVWNTGNALWPLINVRLTAAKVRFSQILEYSVHCITLAKERKEGRR